MTCLKHEFFELLDAVSPKWQEQFRSLSEAAKANGLTAEFRDFLATPAGERYTAAVQTSVDWVAVVERNKRQREAEVAMANNAVRNGLPESPGSWNVDYE